MVSLKFRQQFFIAETLKRLITDAKLIIAIRTQADWLESAYKQNLRQYSSETINQFLRYRRGEFQTRRLVPGRPQFNVEELNYHTYIDHYAQQFGASNILVLPTELLSKNRTEYLRRIAWFMETEFARAPSDHLVNRGYSLISSYIALLLNRFIINEYHGQGILPERPFHEYFKVRRNYSWGFRAFSSLTSRMNLNYVLEHGLDRVLYGRAKFISDKQRATIFEMHKVSNRALDEEYQVGLDELGYY